MRAWNLIHLTWSLQRRSATRFALLIVLIAIGVGIFLTVSELSRASADTLDEAINADLGLANQYTVSFRSTMGLDPQDLRTTTAEALESLHPSDLYFVDTLNGIVPQCPPYSQAGPVTMFVLRSADGAYAPFTGGVDTGGEFDLCLGGQVVPAQALRETTPVEARAIGPGLVVSGAYGAVARLTVTDPPTVTAVVQLPADTNHSDAAKDTMRSALQDTALRAGTTLDHEMTVMRVDEGARVRDASAGVRLMYGLIGWGILVLVGLGLLVAQLVQLRDRTWLLGLARAVGARKTDLAALVALDVALTLLAGFTTAVALALLAQPVVEGFGEQAFQVQLQLVRWEVVPALLSAVVVTLGLGAGYPMLTAMRLDPVEVLERR